jgi:hypothetical protein
VKGKKETPAMDAEWVADVATGRNVPDECARGAEPPGTLATIVLALVFLRLVGGLMKRGLGAGALVLVFECWSFYIYTVYHRRCQPLKGFAIYVVVAILVGVVERMIGG